MEHIRQKLAQNQPLGRKDGSTPTFGQPGGSRPSASAPRQPVEVEVLSSDDEGESKPAAPLPLKPASGSENRPKPAPSPFLPPQAKFPVAYVNGLPVPVGSSMPNAATTTAPPQHPTVIRPPGQPLLAVLDNNAADGEQFTIDTQAVYEERTTADEAQKAMRDLLSGAVGSIDISDVNMEDAVVEGFDENIRLMPHQIQGRIWMTERESGKKAGGILADMGLGKTIQTLARIVDGKPDRAELKGSGFSKTTLIVCPVSVLPQWAEEIEKMTVGLSVVRHHGPSRTTNPEILKRADVVITTYSTLTSEHKVYTMQGANHAAPASSKSKASKDDSDSDDSLVGKSIKKKAPPKRAAKAKLCALFDVNFYRIVLDEAQNIKNRNSKAAQACFAMNSKFRWVLTGTPIQNSVDELFSLFKFLRIRPLNDWDNFSSNISKPVKAGKSKNAMKRLHVVLNATMLRRTKNQQINGEPIIKLPPRSIEEIFCQFDPEERAFYTALEARASSTMNKIEARGELQASYTSILVLLLRLRQACDHPALISKDFLKDLDAVESKVPASQQDDDDEQKQEVDELAGLLDNLGITKALTCNICLEELPKDWKDSQCEDCQKSVGVVSRRKSLSARTKKQRIVDSDDDEEDSDLPPTSAKIRKTLEILQAIYARTKGKRDENGDKILSEKTIIFSQFTSMLDMMGPFLDNAGIRYTRYDGSMKPVDREAALHKIRNDKKCRVILISFKAGGVGLNLTACNNVILLDLWWNPALEDQAFDRAHRLGQKKSVYVYKLTIAESVEDRILKLQHEKRELAAAAYSGGKLSGKAGLGLDDLMKLFRPGHQDELDSDDE